MTHHFFSHMTTKILFAMICALWAIPAAAQSEDAVLVLGHGGIETLQLLDLQPGVQGPTVTEGTLRLFTKQQGPQTIEDVRVLADGRILLTGINKRQLDIFDPMTQALTPVYSSKNAANIRSGSIVTYSAFGTPRRFVFTENITSSINIHDNETDKLVWRQSLFITGGQIEFAQAILLPGAVLAIATNWSNINLFAIDLVELAPGQGPNETRFSNASNIDHPTQTFIRQEIDHLRDLVAIDDQTLIVTTRFRVFAMSTQGDILWTINMADDLNFGGEFASARITNNKTLVLSTFEPGIWTNPHPNHRIHWFDLNDNKPTRRAQSGALNRAPKRVTPAISTGGTGTLNFRAGLQELATGKLANIVASQPLTISSPQPEIDMTLMLNVIFQNNGNQAVSLKQMTILATKGSDCDAPGVPNTPIVTQEELLIEPGEELGLGESLLLKEDGLLQPGKWCLQAAVQDLQSNWKYFAPKHVITIQDEQGNTMPTIPIRDLRVSTPDMPVDLGQMDMNTTPTTPSNNDPDGCGCQILAVKKRTPWSWMFGIVLLIIGYRRQRRDF